MVEPFTTGTPVITGLAASHALPAGMTMLTRCTSLRVLPTRAMVRLQLPRRAIDEASHLRIGDTPLPTTPGSCAGDDPAILWIAPDGWLLVGDRSDGAALAATVRRDCNRRATAVDVSDALVGFELAGPRVRDLLARGTTLEVDGATLAPGRCARTRLAQLPVILRPLAAGHIELIVDRGPAAWLRDWFIDAGSLL